MIVFFIMRKSKVLFIGLGRLGFHMSSHLSKNKNIDLYIFNRSKNRLKLWSKNNKSFLYTDNIKEKFDFIITCLKDDVAVHSVLTNKSLILNLTKNTIVIDHSTISLPQVIKLNAYFKKNNVSFYDAPVSGGEEGAKNAVLTSMIGGSKKNFNKVKNIVNPYCNNITHMGSSGSGQLCKFSNQILICGILISISEAIKFNKVNKLDQNKFYDAVLNGAAGSWQFKNRFPTMIKNQFDFGFSTELMAKDLKYIVNHAKKMNVKLNLTTKAFKLYKKLSISKFKNQDTSSILNLI